MQVAFGPSLLFSLVLPTFFSTLGGVFMPNFEKRWGAEESRGGDRKSNGKEIEGKYGMSCVKGKGEWDSEDNGWDYSEGSQVTHSLQQFFCNCDAWLRISDSFCAVLFQIYVVCRAPALTFLLNSHKNVPIHSNNLGRPPPRHRTRPTWIDQRQTMIAMKTLAKLRVARSRGWPARHWLDSLRHFYRRDSAWGQNIRMHGKCAELDPWVSKLGGRISSRPLSSFMWEAQRIGEELSWLWMQARGSMRD